MDAPSEFRKIELQSPDDFAYLIAMNLRNVDRRVDLAYPRVTGQDDDDKDGLREEVRRECHEWLYRTFVIAAPNCTINGMDINIDDYFGPHAKYRWDLDRAAPHQPPQELLEPFDHRMRQRLEDLTKEQEDLLQDIATLKRTVPAAAAAAHASRWKMGVAADEEALEEEVRRRRAAALGGKGAAVLDVEGRGESQEEIEEEFARAVETLGTLKNEIPAATGKMERAKGVAQYMATSK